MPNKTLQIYLYWRNLGNGNWKIGNTYLLVSQSVEGTGETVKASGERQVGVAESGAHQVRGVCGHVASLVVTAQTILKYNSRN